MWRLLYLFPRPPSPRPPPPPPLGTGGCCGWSVPVAPVTTSRVPRPAPSQSPHRAHPIRALPPSPRPGPVHGSSPGPSPCSPSPPVVQPRPRSPVPPVPGPPSTVARAPVSPICRRSGTTYTPCAREDGRARASPSLNTILTPPPGPNPDSPPPSPQQQQRKRKARALSPQGDGHCLRVIGCGR